MIKWIDLSHEIVNDMSVHPYDDAVKLYQDKFLDEDDYNNFRLEIGMHSGTHIDAPMHLTKSDTFISEIPVERFVGKGCLLDVRDQQVIRYKEEYSDLVCEDDIVLLYTNHSRYYGKKEYYHDYPVIDEELAAFFIRKKVKLVGMDLPSPDDYPFEIHKMFFRHNILIIENLKNLEALLPLENFEVIALPLKIKAEASMVRVVAREL